MDLAAANAAHFSRFFDLMGQSSKASRTEGESWLAVVTQAPHPLGNYAIVQKGTTSSELERALETLASSEFPSSIFYTIPEADPAHEGTLAKAGYTLAGQMPLMALDLANLAETPALEGIECRRVGAKDMMAWTELLAEAYGLPLLLGELCAETARFGSDAADSPMQFFAAFENGRMLSTSQLFLHDGIAGIYCVTTHPDARGRGLGAMVTAEPLRVAAKLGYATGILQSSEMGFPVYKRLGFEPVGAAAFYMRQV